MEKLEREAEESKSLIKVLGDRLTQCARDAEVSSLRAGIVTRQQVSAKKEGRKGGRKEGGKKNTHIYLPLES